MRSQALESGRDFFCSFWGDTVECLFTRSPPGASASGEKVPRRDEPLEKGRELSGVLSPLHFVKYFNLSTAAGKKQNPGGKGSPERLSVSLKVTQSL